MSLAFEMKTFRPLYIIFQACLLLNDVIQIGLFQKVMTYKLGQNANFKNGGTTIQMDILHFVIDKFY